MIAFIPPLPHLLVGASMPFAFAFARPVALTIFFVSALFLTLPTRSARAADIPCEAVEKDVITPDGLLEDWADVPGIDIGDRDPDFSFTARCNYDADTLYLSVDVRDDYLVRTKAARPGEDHLEILFADGDKLEKLVIHPGDSQSRTPRKVQWIPRHSMQGIEIADALQPKGWAIELRIALKSVPGWSPGVPSIKLAVAAYDADSKAHPTIEKTLSTSPVDTASHLGKIEFAEAGISLDAFLRDKKLDRKDIQFDRVGRVLPTGSGRVVVAGKTLGIIGEEYAYLDLPITSPKDILDIRLADLAGDRRDAVLIRYRERMPGGSREVLAAYRMSGEGLHRAFAVEVARAQGTNKLDCRISYIKRPLKKGSATDILIEPLPAAGWTEMNYRERTADDIAPILLPWANEKRARYQFQGDEYTRSE